MADTQQKERRIPRMRTIEASYELLKQYDPSTSVSKHFIRQLVLSGKVKYCMAGSRYLIHFDSLLEYFNNPHIDDESEDAHGTIQAVK